MQECIFQNASYRQESQRMVKLNSEILLGNKILIIVLKYLLISLLVNAKVTAL